jgi:hypothetical protein
MSNTPERSLRAGRCSSRCELQPAADLCKTEPGRLCHFGLFRGGRSRCRRIQCRCRGNASVQRVGWASRPPFPASRRNIRTPREHPSHARRNQCQRCGLRDAAQGGQDAHPARCCLRYAENRRWIRPELEQSAATAVPRK